MAQGHAVLPQPRRVRAVGLREAAAGEAPVVVVFIFPSFAPSPSRWELPRDREGHPQCRAHCKPLEARRDPSGRGVVAGKAAVAGPWVGIRPQRARRGLPKVRGQFGYAPGPGRPIRTRRPRSGPPWTTETDENHWPPHPWLPRAPGSLRSLVERTLSRSTLHNVSL